MSLLNPDSDAPVDHMKLHKDVTNVLRMLIAGAATIFIAAMWVAALAQDVESNKEKLEDAATKEQLATTVEILKRLEKKIDKGDERQRDIQSDLAALKTEVENLKEKVEDGP